MLFLLQLIVITCFSMVIVALFHEKTDFLSYSMLAMLIAVVATFIILPEIITIESVILAIEWEVIFFLIAVFIIVEILDDKQIFQELALRITTKFETNTRKFFWIMCITSTLSAAFIEDISVAIIFIPLIIKTSEKLNINPTPFLLGVTICINLASTLTPFGSSENILIAAKFNLSATWFVLNLGLYFLLTTFLTLFFLDYFILKKSLTQIWLPHCTIYDESCEEIHMKTHELYILEEPIDKKTFNKNMVALLIFIALLFVLPNILLAGIIGGLIFVFINPRQYEKGRKHPDISYYLSRVDYKLVFFFICLFVLVYCMEVNGTISIMQNLVLGLAITDLFLMCILILISTSIFSALLDNVPVTIIFIPIIHVLIFEADFIATPLLIAFILGINLGGNFLPQGAICDMMTLELAKKNYIYDMNYKKLLKIGGIFAMFHLVIGIGYLWFYIYVIL